MRGGGALPFADRRRIGSGHQIDKNLDFRVRVSAHNNSHLTVNAQALYERNTYRKAQKKGGAQRRAPT